MKNRYKSRILKSSLLLVLISWVAGCSENHIPKVHVVEMRQMQFQPVELTVQKGDTVEFVNHDMVAHNIVEAKGSWSSSILPAGKSWKTAVDKSSDYICTIHPTMKGKLIVK